MTAGDQGNWLRGIPLHLNKEIDQEEALTLCFTLQKNFYFSRIEVKAHSLHMAACLMTLASLLHGSKNTTGSHLGA